MSVFLLYAEQVHVRNLLERLERHHIPHGSKAPVSNESQGAIIVWGDEVSSILAQSDWVLNHPSNVKRCTNVERMAEQLNLHGIATAYTKYARNKDGDYSFHYRVPVFHLEALTLFSAQSNAAIRLRMPVTVTSLSEHEATHLRFMEPPNRRSAARDREPQSLRKLGRLTPIFVETGLERMGKRGASAVREAVKALYALGLDYGVVDVVFPASGEPEILSVIPYPELDDRLAELFAEAIGRFQREYITASQRQELPILGADPEFLIADNAGTIVHASRYLPKNGSAGCDVLTIRGVKRFPLAELRPTPTPDPRKLVRHIRQAMQLAADYILDDSLIWVAGAMPAKGFALGGHVHMSRIWLNTTLLRALDNYVALPLVLAEEARSVRRRPRYGFLGDFRRQKHGGFEYRTLPSWLVSPRLARGVLASTALVATHYKELTQRPLTHAAVQRQYYDGSKSELLPLVKSLWSDMERLPGYQAWADWLEPYKQSLFAMQAWDERRDIRPLWKISPFDGQVHDPTIHAIIGTEK